MADPKHKTLVPNTAASVTMDIDYRKVEVTLVKAGAEPVYVRVDGTPPGIEEDGSHVLPAAIGFIVLDVPTTGPTVVRFKSATAALVSVRSVRD